jgi:hypothetical protein
MIGSYMVKKGLQKKTIWSRFEDLNTPLIQKVYILQTFISISTFFFMKTTRNRNNKYYVNICYDFE